MTPTNDFNTAKNLLEKHNQSQLLKFWEDLDSAEKQSLVVQISELDFDLIDEWIENLVKKAPCAAKDSDLNPAPFYAAVPTTEKQQNYYEKAWFHGKKLISEGKVAAFIVAGGQGTRLGFDGPKGDFRISPVKNKKLFELFAEQIGACEQRYNRALPWYIMTSPLNHKSTLEIFKSQNYFGLSKDNIFIFQQGTIPSFGLDGRILLADKANISCSPDGHGGSLKALYKSGAIEDMKKQGVEYISYFQVDNPLINIFDPLFIGLHSFDGAEMSSKALLKSGPDEKVGVFCLADGKMTVIEYSDLPEELAKARNPDGSLVFSLGSIAIHMLDVEFVARLNKKGFALPLHRAVKKISYIDAGGNQIEPSEPNGVKLETFVFDALPLAKKSIILETIRQQEFAPVKNAEGVDSVETSKKMMTARSADWLESAGIKVPRKKDGSPDCEIEIAAGFVLYKEDVVKMKDKIQPIKAGDSVYLQ
ncbi:MAG: UDPGP type 1 family protein [Phycisphaerae bacterium]